MSRPFPLNALAAAILLSITGSASAAPVFQQDFDTDASLWFPFGGSITQVASGGGTLGVTSAGGSAGHAEVGIGTSPGDGAFTRFGGYSSVWPGQFIRQSLDVYIDPAAGSIGDGWFLDNAVNNTSGSWLEAGGVGALKATDGNWWVAADGDGGAYPGGAAGGVGLQILTAGWYTILSEWIANGDGLTVDRNTFISNSSGTQLYSNFNPSQVPLTGGNPLGGWRYGWIASSGQGGPFTLAIDNSQLEINDAAVVPEPSSLALFLGGIGCAGLVRYRRRKKKVC